MAEDKRLAAAACERASALETRVESGCHAHLML